MMHVMNEAMKSLGEYLKPFLPQQEAIPEVVERPHVEDRWDSYFIDLAVRTAYMSKDPSTRVGAVIVGSDRNILATGFNGFPRGVKDDWRLYERARKYQMVAHAEMNAILDAARRGISLRDATIYVIGVNHNHFLFGFPPCGPCATGIIQAGISEVVTLLPGFAIPQRWKDSVEIAMEMFEEVGISYRELGPVPVKTLVR